MDRAGGREVGTSWSHSRQMKGHMTYIYLTDLDEEAIVNFVKEKKEVYDKINKHFKSRPGRNACWRGLSTSVSCLSRCARLAGVQVQVWPGSKRKDREAELDSW